MGSPKVVTGAHVTLYINGKAYGQVSSFSYSSATSRKAIYALDSGEPYELAPGQTKISGSINVFRTIQDGGAEGAGIVASLKNIPLEKYITLALIERSSDTVIFQTEKAMIVNQQWQVGVKGAMTGTLQFEAINWRNESAT